MNRVILLEKLKQDFFYIKKYCYTTVLDTVVFFIFGDNINIGKKVTEAKLHIGIKRKVRDVGDKGKKVKLFVCGECHHVRKVPYCYTTSSIGERGMKSITY